MKFSQNLHYIFQLGTSCLRSNRSKYIWRFHVAKHRFYFLWIHGHISLFLICTCYSSYTTEWNFIKISQNFHCIFPLCSFYFRFLSRWILRTKGACYQMGGGGVSSYWVLLIVCVVFPLAFSIIFMLFLSDIQD